MSDSVVVVGGGPAKRIPFVKFLDLELHGPRLLAQECTHCGARYFDLRMACARCFGREFVEVPVATTGIVRSFTIVHRAAPEVRTPFVSAVIDLDDGTAVKANILECPPDPEHVRLGMRVRLTTFTAASAPDGTEAIAFGFTPAALRNPEEHA